MGTCMHSMAMDGRMDAMHDVDGRHDSRRDSDPAAASCSKNVKGGEDDAGAQLPAFGGTISCSISHFQPISYPGIHTRVLEYEYRHHVEVYRRAAPRQLSCVVTYTVP